MTIAELARAELRALQPYEAAQQVDDTIRLNANEAPWSSSADRFRRPLNRYPEIRPARLARALGEYFGCDPARLLVTRGTSEAIDLLIRAFCREGKDNVVTTSPTFSMYAHYATVQGAEHRAVATMPGDDFAIETDAILAACDERTRLVFICSPNNPTGTLVSRMTLIDLLERRGEQSAIVVDEAYIEFSGEASTVELLDRYPNLVVLRTLSKALAFAGARCGAVMGPAEVIRILNAIQAPYAMSTPVVECVEDALQSAAIDEAKSRIAEIVVERERLMAALASFSCVQRVWPSAANFFLIKVNDAEVVLREARESGILLRDFGRSLPDCIRITVGERSENERLLALLARIEGGVS